MTDEIEAAAGPKCPFHALLNPSWFRLILALNAFLGLLALEIAWKKIERQRNPNRELDALFPQFKRTDCEKFEKWQFIPGAMTIMIPRILSKFIIGASLTLIAKIILAG